MDRVTLKLNVCWYLKLPVHVIGKAQKPRCIKGTNIDFQLSTVVKKKNAWMTCDIFHYWFHDDFVPYVGKEL